MKELEGPFTREVLNSVGIVIIKNALSKRNALRSPPTEAAIVRAWRLPAPSAFSKEEIQTLHQWVVSGGALLLVFDHMPMPGAAEGLASAFGIEISNGFALDERALQDSGNVARAGAVVFSRSDGTLADNPVTNGRGSAGFVDSVATNSGSAFRLPAHARSLLTLGPSFVSLLPEVAWQFSDATARKKVAGWSQGGILRVGRGRLAGFGDGAILMTPDTVALLPDKSRRARFGQNPRLLLNVVHWLSGLLGEQQ